MTNDEQIIKAALDMAAYRLLAEGYDEDSRAVEMIRAITPAEVLAGLRTRCAECDCGDGDCTWIASGPAEEYEECICPAPCPIHPSPDAVARLVEAETQHAWLDVMDERVRQVEMEGFERQYDDAYQSRDLAAAAACYAMIAGAHQREVFSAPPIGWPWAKSWWKPTDPRRDLVKAGALILAEIERLDRAACKGVRDE